MADVTGVAEGTGEVAFEDIGIEVLRVPAADSLDEVAEVIAAALEFLDQLIVVIIGLHCAVAAHGDPAFFAFHEYRHAAAAVGGAGTGAFLHAQTTHLKDQRGSFVVMINDLRVGGFAIILVSESAADAPDARGEFHVAEEPAGDVHLVDALVSEIAITVIPHPVPVVMQAFTGERFLRGRAEPEIVIHLARNILGIRDITDAAAALVAEASGNLDLAEVASLHPLHGILNALGAASLCAGLDNLFVLPGGVHQLAAFPHVVAHGLLHVNILAGLDSPDGGEAVPVVRGSHSYHVEFLLFEHHADVLIAGDFVFGCAGFEHLFVDITQGGELHALLPLLHALDGTNVAVAAATKADGGAAQRFVGALHLRPALGGPGHRGAGV